MTDDQPLRVVIADDQASVREGLVLLLGGLPGIDVVGAAADGEQALEKEQASMIRWYTIWRNNHAYDKRLRRIVDRANVA